MSGPSASLNEELKAYASEVAASGPKGEPEYAWVFAVASCDACGKEVLYHNIHPLDPKRDKGYQVATKTCPTCKDWVRVHILPTEGIGVCPHCDDWLDNPKLKSSQYVFPSHEAFPCPACGDKAGLRVTTSESLTLDHEQIVHLVEDILDDLPKAPWPPYCEQE